MNELVSVVIPTFNHGHFLGRALQSVRDQTYPHWEVVVVDNHSTDDTDKVVQAFDDPRLRLLKIHNHGIIASSRNLGICEAKGGWIAFLDSDDYWYPDKLQASMDALEADNSYDVVCNNELSVDTRTGARRVLHYGPFQRDFYRALLVDGNRLSPSATIVRHNFLAQHELKFSEDRQFVTVEDYGFWLDLARLGARFKFIREVQGEYVVHDSNSSTGLVRHWQNCEALVHHHVFDVQRFDDSPARLWRLAYPQFRVAEARRLLAGGERAQALSLMLKTWMESPYGATRCVLTKILRRVGRRWE